MNDLFRHIWSEHGQIALIRQGYDLQLHIATQKPATSPEQVFLPYLKPLGSLGYAHVIIGYSAHPKAERQHYLLGLSLLRHGIHHEFVTLSASTGSLTG